MLVATGNSTVVAYITNKEELTLQRYALFCGKIMTWCHHYQITLKARHMPGCLNVMTDLLSRSNQVQSTEWSLDPHAFIQICQKWFTPPVDLFATHLNHNFHCTCSSPRPKCLGHRCSKHKLDQSMLTVQ